MKKDCIGGGKIIRRSKRERGKTGLRKATRKCLAIPGPNPPRGGGRGPEVFGGAGCANEWEKVVLVRGTPHTLFQDAASRKEQGTEATLQS